MAGQAAHTMTHDPTRYLKVVCKACKQHVVVKVIATLNGDWTECPVCGRVWRVR